VVSYSLPNGAGKDVRVAVFAQGGKMLKAAKRPVAILLVLKI